MIKVYGVPSCKKIRNTRALLDENHIEYEFINVKKQPFSPDKLEQAAKQVDLNTLVNSKGLTYRKLGLKDKNLSDGELLQWLFNEQGMIKRPLIEKDQKFHTGFDKEAIINFVNQ